MTNFYLDTHADKKGDCGIRVSIRTNGGRLMTSIGYSISPAYWDAGKMQVEPGTDKKPVFNAKGIPAATINARIAAIKAAFSQIEATPGAVSIEALRGTLDAITGRAAKAAAAAAAGATGEPAQAAPKSEVLAYFDAFLKEESRNQQWAAGTLDCWNAFRQHLANFKKDLSFADLNEKGLNSFVEYLRTRAASAIKRERAKERKAKAQAAAKAATTPEAAARAAAEIARAERILKDNPPQGLEEKTAQKHFSNLKWFLGWAIRKGACNEKAVLSYRPKFKVLAKPVIFLTREELLKLYNYQIPAGGTVVKLTDHTGAAYEKKVEFPGALEKTRDLFCFCAFTSLRYSDMAALKRTDIFSDRIEITTQKTNDRLTIPLNNQSRAILDKYSGLQDPSGRALPAISNQKMNDYLKDLCELCGFNEPITRTYYRAGQRVEETAPKWALMGTHAGRRTFICNALTIGIPPQVVMKFTGHSDYKAMKPYIDIAGADAAKAMQLLNF